MRSREIPKSPVWPVMQYWPSSGVSSSMRKTRHPPPIGARYQPSYFMGLFSLPVVMTGAPSIQDQRRRATDQPQATARAVGEGGWLGYHGSHRPRPTHRACYRDGWLSPALLWGWLVVVGGGTGGLLALAVRAHHPIFASPYFFFIYTRITPQWGGVMQVYCYTCTTDASP